MEHLQCHEGGCCDRTREEGEKLLLAIKEKFFMVPGEPDTMAACRYVWNEWQAPSDFDANDATNLQMQTTFYIAGPLLKTFSLFRS